MAASTSALASAAANLLPGGSGNEPDEIDTDRRIPIPPPPSDLKLLPDELDPDPEDPELLDPNPPFLLPFLRSIGISGKHPNAAGEEGIIRGEEAEEWRWWRWWW